MSSESRPQALTGNTEGYILQSYHDGKILRREEAESLPLQFVTGVVPGVPVGQVHYAVGVTKNMGNYETVKLTVGVTLPTVVEGIQAAMDAAKVFVDKQLAESMKAVNDFKARSTNSSL